MNGFSHHHLPLTGREPASFDEFRLWAKGEAGRHHSAHRYIHLAGSILAGQYRDHHPLTRRDGLALSVFRDAGQGLQGIEQSRVETTGKFGGRTLAHHQHVQCIAAGNKGFLQPGQ